MSPSSKKVEALSRELAAMSGLKLRPARQGESAHSTAGILRGRIPDEFFHWRKCPVHDTWLQPEVRPFKHWRCAVQISANDGRNYYNGRCEFIRTAKLRTFIERRIFSVALFLDEQNRKEGFQ